MTAPRMLTEALRNLFRRPATMDAMPEVDAPPGYRGAPYLQNPEACTGCGLCAKDCPSSCIVLTAGAPEAETAPKKPQFMLDMCTFCGQCADSCVRKAIKLSEKPPEAVFHRSDLRGSVKRG